MRRWPCDVRISLLALRRPGAVRGIVLKEHRGSRGIPGWDQHDRPAHLPVPHGVLRARLRPGHDPTPDRHRVDPLLVPVRREHRRAARRRTSATTGRSSPRNTA